MTDDEMDRRKALAALGATGVAAVAGCLGEEGGGGNESGGNGDGSAVPSRPQLDFDPDQIEGNRALAYLVRSAEYQNAILEREFG